MQIIECVPNFSEGRNQEVIDQIAQAIRSVEGVQLLHIDQGYDANRTVMTFVGSAPLVVEAAYRAIAKSCELIDMRQHHGEHPRFGATDVCPLIPISGISMEETVAYSKQLGERVGKDIGMHVYLYEESASKEEHRNLAACRKGEYEGLSCKIKDPNWIPDYGQKDFNEKNGAVAIGARHFLVAYNVNLNTESVDIANKIAKLIRESGSWITNNEGEKIHIPGRLKYVKAIGWYMQEYECAQVSMNLTNIEETPLYVVFTELEKIADSFGIEITGSELIGMIPLKPILEVAQHICGDKFQSEMTTQEQINLAVDRLKLNSPRPFVPEEKVLLLKTRDTYNL